MIDHAMEKHILDFIDDENNDLFVSMFEGQVIKIESTRPKVYNTITIEKVNVRQLTITNIKTSRIVITDSICKVFEINKLEADEIVIRNNNASEITLNNIEANRIDMTNAFNFIKANVSINNIRTDLIILTRAFKSRFETFIRFEDCDIKSAETDEAFITMSEWTYDIDEDSLAELLIDDDEKLVKAFFTRDELEKLKEYGQIFRDLVRAGIISLPYRERNAKEVEAIYNSMDRIKKLIEYKLEKK